MDVRTLQDLLARGAPVAVYDIRRSADHDSWTIPGARPLDVYDQIWDGDHTLLDQAGFPQDIPVVLMCATGKTSQMAADHLATKGVRVASLEGGMQAWNAAWNHVERAITDDLALHQVRRTGKDCLSYLLVSGEEALVVDADVDPQVYLDLARRLDVRIVGTMDTHLHADHLSRSHRIARHLLVPYHMHEAAALTFPHSPLSEGDQVSFGSQAVEVVATPGHTWDSVAYHLPGDLALTGDTLFVDGVGRPDLGAGKTEVQDRASALHASIARLMGLPGATIVLPAHASAPLPFDQVQWSARVDEIRDRVPLVSVDEDAFVSFIRDHTPDVPETYMRIVALNRDGVFPEDEWVALEAGANRCAAVV